VPDFREAGHLPQRREGGLPADPDGLPRQRRGITPQMHGRFPDYDVLSNADHWDAVTREVVMARVNKVPPIRFFNDEETRTLSAFCDCVTAQDRDPRIPVLNFVDQKLYEGKLDGYQFVDMPDDREVWRVVARELGAIGYSDMSLDLRHAACERFANGELELPFDVSKAWSIVMRDVLQAFYSHPWSWNEIGFGGPAYPRGYTRLEYGMRENWEGREAFDQDPVRDTEERGLE
jgi:hypothetical protein